MDIINRFRDIKEITEHNNNIESEADFIVLKNIEEMAELTQALLKYDLDEDSVLEEIADVYITLNQLFTKVDSERLDKMIDYKILRTKKRLGLTDEYVEDNFNGYASREAL